MQSPLVVNVKRFKPELIAPAKPTPYEVKILSDIDDQKGIRVQINIFQIYQNSVEMQGRDPVEIIKDAIAKTLVYYYPFAGRLMEGANGKLMVQCSGEGVLFTEASADVRLDQFGDLKPPFPAADDLLYDVSGSAGILHCPLLLIQVTNLNIYFFVIYLTGLKGFTEKFTLLQNLIRDLLCML